MPLDDCRLIRSPVFLQPFVGRQGLGAHDRVRRCQVRPYAAAKPEGNQDRNDKCATLHTLLKAESTYIGIGLLLAGHQYEFRVTAENDHGESVMSTPVGTAVQTAPPRDLRAVPHDLGAALSSEPARPGVRVPCVCIAGLTMRWSTAPK